MLMRRASDRNIVLEDCRLMFRNFSGAPDPFGHTDRVFHVVLDNEVAEVLSAEGWNIRALKPRNEEEEHNPCKTLKVKIGEKFTPTIIVISNNVKTRLSGNDISILDCAEIDHADMVINPYSWSQPTGGHGITAYLRSLYVTFVDDPLIAKYSGMTYEEEIRQEPMIEIKAPGRGKNDDLPF